MAVFSRRLMGAERDAARYSWRICADLRTIAAGLCASMILMTAVPLASRSILDQHLERRLAGCIARLDRLEGAMALRAADLLAACRDLQRAIVGLRDPAALLGSRSPLLDCYAAMTDLRRGLWGFELRPEGAPLSRGGLDGFELVSLIGDPVRAD